MSDEDIEESLDTMPNSNGFSICDYDDTEDTELVLTDDFQPDEETKSSDMEIDTSYQSNDLLKIQELVTEMKEGFSQALNELSKIQYSDRALEDKLEEHKLDYQKQLAEVLQMILSIKAEFGTPLGQIKVALDEHKVLKRQVATLQRENALLVAELEKTGTITNIIRKRCSSLDSPVSRCISLTDSQLLSTPPNGQTSSEHDSGVVATAQNDSTSTSNGERSPPEVAQITPMVHNYIHNLHSPGVQAQEDLSGTDSDSSVTAIANKSIDLSRSLVDKFAAETDEENVDQHVRHCKSVSSPSINSSPYSRKSAPHELAYRDKQRSRTAHELVDTERKYCSCLWTMVDFLTEALKSSGIITTRDVKLMFPVALSSMYEFHADILKRFEERISNWKIHAIVGDIFARMTDPNSEFLLLYQTYLNDFHVALEAIKKCSKQSHKFRKLLQTLQIHPVCDGLDLTAFLLTPIQRIPRYVLLIKQMLTFTEDDHPDHYYLVTTLERLKTFLDQLNSSIESGQPMDQYSYVVDNRSLPGIRGYTRRSSSQQYDSGSDFDTGSDVTPQSLYNGDGSELSRSARKFATLKRSWGRLSQSLSGSRGRLLTRTPATPTDSLPDRHTRAKLFLPVTPATPGSDPCDHTFLRPNQVRTVPRDSVRLRYKHKRRSGTPDSGRPKSLVGSSGEYTQYSLHHGSDTNSLEYDPHMEAIQGAAFNYDLGVYDRARPRSKSQSNLLESSPRQRESLSRSLVESDIIDKLLCSKKSARSMPSVAQLEQQLSPVVVSDVWREHDDTTYHVMPSMTPVLDCTVLNNKRMNKVTNTPNIDKLSHSVDCGKQKKKASIIRDSLKNMFSRKRNSKLCETRSSRLSMPSDAVDQQCRSCYPDSCPPPQYSAVARLSLPANDVLTNEDGTPCSAV